MTTQPPHGFEPGEPSSPALAPKARGAGRRTADVTVSVILLTAGLIGFALLAFVSLFFAMMSDGCYGDSCDTGLMSIGWLIALIAPPAVFIVAVAWTIIRLTRRKTAWWVPLVGGVVGVVFWLIGVGLMDAGLRR